MSRTLVLGSSSKARQILLKRLCLPFEIAAPNVDETSLPNETPTDLVLRLAKKKALAVAKNYSNALIIGADQVGVLNNEILGKPLTRENAISQLTQMSGKRIQFLIGLCLLDSQNNTMQLLLETFDVEFRELSLGMITNYLDREYVLECAGSFKAEGLGIALVKEFIGKDFTGLVGLPLIQLTQMLKAAGYEVI